MNVKEVEDYIKSELGISDVTYDDIDDIHAFYFETFCEDCCISSEVEGEWIAEVANRAFTELVGGRSRVIKDDSYQAAIARIIKWSGC